jgi:peptidoglycan/LPS O-acetylase OafA/YrhL
MIGSLMMRVSAVILVIGMLWGIEMGIRQDFAMAPAHAHFNLVGGVLLFLFGLYYRLVPQAGASALAIVQGWLHIVGAIVFAVGVAIVISKGESLVAIPIVGSLVVLMAVALFAVIVFRTTSRA